MRAQRLVTILHIFIPRVQQVLAQTTRRVLQGAQVPAGEKLASIFEPHTAIIRRGKLGKPTEFGRVVWLDEVDGGIISRYAVLAGNPDDATQFIPSLEHHIQVFGRAPSLVAGDGKVGTPMNEQVAQQRGVRRVVLPQPGRKTAARRAHERQRWFRQGRPVWRGAYATTLDHFRHMVPQAGIDLDGDPAALALLAQAWAGSSWTGHARPIAAATYNQRLAIIASFFTYARRHQFLRSDNPIDLVERRPVQSYATARAIQPSTARGLLSSIDRTTLHGAPDYALLTVGMSTGRRASKLAGLRWRDVQLSGGGVTLQWTRTKGGKQARDTLSAKVSAALLHYLQLAYGAQLGGLAPDAPIWRSTSRQNPGAAITTQAIGDICQRHLGTAKIHTLRHTFAQAMLTAGGAVRDVQERLGHSNSATTERYLQALLSADNPYADALADLFGV